MKASGATKGFCYRVSLRDESNSGSESFNLMTTTLRIESTCESIEQLLDSTSKALKLFMKQPRDVTEDQKLKIQKLPKANGTLQSQLWCFDSIESNSNPEGSCELIPESFLKFPLCCGSLRPTKRN